MAASARNNAAWEKVLAAIEADAAKAAALLLDETDSTAISPAATTANAGKRSVATGDGVAAYGDTSETAAEVDAAIAESLGESLAESRRGSSDDPRSAAGRTAYIPASSGAPARFQRPTGPGDSARFDVLRHDQRAVPGSADSADGTGGFDRMDGRGTAGSDPRGLDPNGFDGAPADGYDGGPDAVPGYDAVPGVGAHSPIGATGDEPAPAVPAAQPTPATWRLPANPEDFALELPDPADMPPIPEELRERIERLHTRIEALKSDLAKALAQARNAPARPVRLTQPTSTPGFVDRKL